MIWAEGRDVLINGSNHYLNFGTDSGSGGYGFRDNGGVMQWKNSGGAWAGFSSGGGGGGSGTVATSSSETQFRVPFWDSTSATPALLNGGDNTFSYNPTADRLTTSYASTTGISASYASSTSGFFGSLSIASLSGILKATAGAISAATAGTDYVAGGTGANTQVTYFTGSGVIAGDAGMTYDATADRLTATYGSSTAFSATNANFTKASSTYASTTAETTNNLWINGLTAGGLGVDTAGKVYGGATTTAGTGLTYSGNAFNVNTSQNISTLSNLTTNGLVTTSGGTGALSVTANGTNGQVLAMSGGVPTWIASTTYANGTGISTSFAAGQLTITNTSPLSGLSTSFPFSFSNPTLSWIGLATTSQPTAGQMLYSNGTNGLTPVSTTTLTVTPDLSSSGTLGALVGGSASTLSLNMATAHSWTGLQQFANASSTLLSTNGPFYIGTTSTTTIIANATSTFNGGINIPTGKGCFAINGTCISSGGGAVSSVDNLDGTLTVSPTTGAVVASINLGNVNTWTGRQNFTRASSSQESVFGPLYVGTTSTTTISGGGTASSSFNGGLRVVTGGIGVNTLTSCDTIDTDGSGNFICGTDSGGTNAFEIATTSGLSVSQLPYYTQTSGRTTLGGVGTTTLTISGPFTTSATAVVLGSSPITSTYWGLSTTSQPSSSNVLTSNGAAGVYGTATTSVTNGTGISFTGTAGALLGGSNLTITNSSPLSGLTASFPFSFSNPTLSWIGLATSTALANTQLVYGTGVNTIGSEAAFTYDASLDRLTTTYASTTGFSSSYASSTDARFGTLRLNGLSDGCLNITSNVVGSQSCGSGATTEKWATSSADTLAIYPNTALRLGIGTTTPKWALTVASSTGPQLTLTDGSLTSAPFNFRAINNSLYLSTSSPTTFATTSLSIFSIDSSTGTTSFNKVRIGPLGTAAGAFLAVNPSGDVIATTTPSGGGSPTTISTTYATSTGSDIYVMVSVDVGDVLNVHARMNVPASCNSAGRYSRIETQQQGWAASTTQATGQTFERDGLCSSAVFHSMTATTTETVSIGALTGGVANENALLIEKIPASLTGASATVQGSNQQVQFNDNGAFGGAVGFVWDKIASKLGIGSTSPWAKLSVTSNDYTAPSFSIGTTTGGTYSELLNIWATSTTQINTSALSLPDTSGVRVFIGGLMSYAQLAFNFAQLYIQGWYDQSDSQAFCDSPVGATAISADGVAGCGGFFFNEDGTGTLTALSPTNGGYTYGQLSTTAANDGAGVFLNAASAGAFSIATSTPIFAADARIASVQLATTSHNFYIGFTNLATAGTTYETRPTQGCYFTASSTEANWKAVSQNSAANITITDTGVASSSVITGTGEWRRFYVAADANGCSFFLQTSQSTDLAMVAKHTTNLPTSVLNAGVYMADTLSGAGALFNVKRIRAWWRDFIPAL